MTKTYKFNFIDGNYVLQYSKPDATEPPFLIDAESMQFDTKKFYQYIFSDVKEVIEIVVDNQMNQNTLDPAIWKKGERVYRVISDLCSEISQKINVECFNIC